MLKKTKTACILLLSLLLPLGGQIEASDTNINVTIPQQDGKVIGTVEDGQGAVIGASIIVKGTTNGTITDVDGKFQLTNVKKGDIIVISYIGYATQEIAYAGQTVINITLQEDTQALNEVVVTALGIKREKKALGYAISSVKGEELTEAGTPMNAMQALYGKTSGLQLQTTASGPSGGMNIKIRNAASLNDASSTRPLIVVDGIPIHDENTSISGDAGNGGDHGTGINDINSEDIASIEILKGAKAAVLYGSEGANGVILISTKTGGKKGLGIDFGVNYTWNMSAYYPEYQNEFGSGASPGTARISNISDDGFYMMQDPATGQMVESLWRGASANFGPPLDGRKLLWFDDTYRAYTAKPNNLTDLFRTGHQSNVNFAISNSGDLGSFRLSYNYRDYASTSVGASNAAHSFNFASNLKANNYVNIKINTQYSTTKDHNAPYLIGDMVTYGIPRELDVNVIRDQLITEGGYNKFAMDHSMSTRYRATSYLGDYYWSQLVNDNNYTRNHLIQSANIDVTFNDKISWNSLGGIDWTIVDHEVKRGVEEPLTQESKQGYYGMRSIRNMTLYAQTAFNYNQTFNDVWDLSVMIGGSVKRNTMENQNQYISETFALENWFSLENTTEDFGPRSERTRGRDLMLSVYGSAQLAYANQIYLEFQARNDWSSILPPQNNHYFYPGVSASWIFTETFDIPFMPFGKLRASWADVGRPGDRYFGNVSFSLGAYGGAPTMSVDNTLPPAEFTGVGFPSPNLKPERKREYEIGFETSFLEGSRISADFSFFHNNTYNQIISLDVPTSSGVNKASMNAGDIAQNGWELSVNTKPYMSKDWNWELGFNLSNYTTKIKELGGGINQLTLKSGEGATVVAPVGGEYGEVWVRPYVTDEQGNRVVNQGTGVWEFDQTKYKKVGKITPDIIGGVTTSLSYKNFTLNAIFDFQFGATLLSQTNMYLLGNGSGKESLKYRDEARGGLPYYMNMEGERILLDSHDAAVPADSYYPFILHDGVITEGVTPDGEKNTMLITAEQYYQGLYWQSARDLSEDKIYKSDYISLRSISLSYTLPKKFINKLKIQNARLNVFANNVCYLYKDVPNVNPESALGTNSSTEQTITPGIRSVGVGLNVSF